MRTVNRPSLHHGPCSSSIWSFSTAVALAQSPELLRSRIRFCMGRNHQPKGTIALGSILIRSAARSPERAQGPRAFRLTLTYMNVGDTDISTWFYVISVLPVIRELMRYPRRSAAFSLISR